MAFVVTHRVTGLEMAVGRSLQRAARVVGTKMRALRFPTAEQRTARYVSLMPTGVLAPPSSGAAAPR
jgi:hypothetical protein